MWIEILSIRYSKEYLVLKSEVNSKSYRTISKITIFMKKETLGSKQLGNGDYADMLWMTYAPCKPVVITFLSDL